MSKNVFTDLGFSKQEAAELKLKSYLFMILQEAIKSSKMNQEKIAKKIGTDQPKVSKILNGKFDEFSVERIVQYLQRLGQDIHINAVVCPPTRKKGVIVVGKRSRIAV